MFTQMATRATVLLSAAALAVTLLPGSPAGAASKQVTITGLASVSVSGATGNSSSNRSSISTGGRFIAFASNSTDLIPGDGNGHRDVFVRDTLAATTTRVSVSSAGAGGNGDSDEPALSPDGRFLAFSSAATNLVPGDTNGHVDVFVRNLLTGVTRRASVATNTAAQAVGGDSDLPQISADGSEVVFESDATNLVPFDVNGATDVFVRGVDAGYTEIETVTTIEAPVTAGGDVPAMSGNGRYVVFDSKSKQLSNDPSATNDVFIRDRVLGTTAKVSVSRFGTEANADSHYAEVSDSGRFVVFQSEASDIALPTGAALKSSAYRRDLTLGTTLLISQNAQGGAGNEGGGGVSISADGNRVLFSSSSSNLHSGDTNGVTDAYVRDVTANTTTRTSVGTIGGQLNSFSLSGDISPDGATTSFSTFADNAADPDTNQTFDILWRGTMQIGPFTDSTGLLQQAGTDFNGVPFALGPLVNLNNTVLAGVASPSSAIDALAHGTFDDHRGPVMRLYWAFFHRIPDQGGLDYWVAKNTAGMKITSIASSFAKSSEFKTTYGTLSDDGFVKLVYTNVLERPADAAGLTYWKGKLGSGTTRGEMMASFSEAPEGKRIMRPVVDTVLVYLGMIRRLPTESEFGAAISLLSDGTGSGPTEELIVVLLQTSAYAARFV